MRKPQKDQKDYLDMIRKVRTWKDGIDFSNWVNAIRRNGELRNDDTSLIFIELGEGGL
jgi:hypothetical protein